MLCERDVATRIPGRSRDGVIVDRSALNKGLVQRQLR